MPGLYIYSQDFLNDGLKHTPLSTTSHKIIMKSTETYLGDRHEPRS